MIELEEFIRRVKAWLETEKRKDALYRVPVLHSQLGDLEKILYHDPELNPEARAFGTEEEEIRIFGETFCHLAAYAISRGIDIREAIKKGLERLEDRDGFRKTSEVRETDEIVILKGIIGSPGLTEGKAVVVNSISELEQLPKKTEGRRILVAESLDMNSIDLVRYMGLKGIVTNQGGRTSHPAMHARERGIPCIVATEKATEIIKNGDWIIIDGENKDPEKGEVKKSKRR